LGLPNLPFVIATTGMVGGPTYSTVELAQLAMANTTTYPDFAGNVSVIDTRITYKGFEFGQPVTNSPANEGFHWNRNAKTYLNIGLAMGDALSILAPGRCPFAPTAVGGPGGVTLTWRNGTETPTNVSILRNGVQIASVPASPASFLDTTAVPSQLNYELIFTMPITACPPLTPKLNGGVTHLKVSPVSTSLVLNWTNNMTYTGIEVRRNGTAISGVLAGNATTFTDTAPLTSGIVTYTVAPTTGTSIPASAQLNLNLKCPVGVIQPFYTNGGINPATGAAWQAGDSYRVAFVTRERTQATSTNIATYNSFVQTVAASSVTFPQLGNGSWKVIGSTATVAARDNTGTNPNNATGLPVFLTDGNTIFARNNDDLWNEANTRLDLDEDGLLVEFDVFNGTQIDGTINADAPLGSTGGSVSNGSTTSDSPEHWLAIFGASTTDLLPVYALSDPLFIINTADTTAPALSSLAPPDNAANVSIGANLVATFNENILKGTGNITVKNLTDNTQTTIAITSPQVTITGAVLTINPTANLTPGKDYAIQIDTTCIDDTGGKSYVGITDDTTWNFSTSSAAASYQPGLWYGTVAGDINTFAINPNTLVTVNLSQTEDDIAENTTEIYSGEIYDADGQISFTEDIDDQTRLYINGVLVLSSDDWNDRKSTANLNLTPGWHEFELRISNGGGGSGPNDSPGFGYDPNGGTNWTHPSDPGNGSLFRSLAADTSAPTTSSLNPADNATGVAVTSNLVATFNEIIVIGTGDITINNLTDNTQTTIALPNAQVTVSGATLTINPTANLLVGKNYAIQIAATAVKDLANNNFPGITNDTTWNFTTIKPYDIWATGAAFNADANGDGLDNGMAWLLGAANPSENAVAKLPKATFDGAKLRLNFRCLKSTMRGGVILKLQSSSDLGISDPWTNHETSVPDADTTTASGVVFDTTEDGGYIHVIADIPESGIRKFARLKAELAEP
jgi:hypothetical protein